MTTPRVAYIVSRFPKTTETFIVREICELERFGMPIELFALVRERDELVHPMAESLLSRLHYADLSTRRFWAAQWFWLWRAPMRYLRAWWAALWGNRGSRIFLLRALLVVPLSAYFAREMLRLKIDRVHAHWATHATLAAYTVKRLTGIPYSFTAHAHDLYVDRTMLGEKIEAADFVVSISQHNIDLLRRHYGSRAVQKTVIVRCGVDTSEYRRSSDDRRVSTPGVSLVCVASLQEYKGHEYLLQAIRNLKSRGLDVTCSLIGDGPCRDAIEQRVRQLDLADSVSLLGRRTMSEVHNTVSRADLFVLASVTTETGRVEGIPVALMEALALEVPCVATAVSGVGELIQHKESGILVPERDARALANGIQYVIELPDRGAALARRGREAVVHGYDITANAEKLHTLLRDGVSALR